MNDLFVLSSIFKADALCSIEKQLYGELMDLEFVLVNLDQIQQLQKLYEAKISGILKANPRLKPVTVTPWTDRHNNEPRLNIGSICLIFRRTKKFE